MVVITCERKQDELWLRQLIEKRHLPARTAKAGEGWTLRILADGGVQSRDQVITCGTDPRCSVTASSLLEGGMASLQREMRTLSGKTLQPQEISMEGLPGTAEQKLTGAAVLLLLRQT